MGLDNYNGLPTGRVTSSNAGISPNALGSAGGSQYLPSHTHAIYDPGHNHLTNAVQGPVTVAGGIAGGGIDDLSTFIVTESETVSLSTFPLES